MQRTLSMLAVGLTILGLELSTKIVSLAAGRVSSGFSAIANGLEFHVSTGRFLTGVAMLVIGLSLGCGSRRPRRL